jgi:hypothetical protein
MILRSPDSQKGLDAAILHYGNRPPLRLMLIPQSDGPLA